jgi:thymidylate synthase
MQWNNCSEDVIDDALRQHGVPVEILSLKLYARSQDVPIGTVFNIASYSAFLIMMAHHFNMKPGRYIHSMGDAHIYTNQVDAVKEWLSRGEEGAPPTMAMATKRESIFDYTEEDFILSNYHPQPPINIPLAV